MHTITLKSDDQFFELLTNLVKSLNTTKSDLIRKSVIHYQQSIEKEKLRVQIKNASYNVRNQSLAISQDFDDTLIDGLKNV